MGDILITNLIRRRTLDAAACVRSANLRLAHPLDVAKSAPVYLGWGQEWVKVLGEDGLGSAATCA